MRKNQVRRRRSDQRRPASEVGLSLLARRALHPPERQRRCLAEAPHEPPDRVVADLDRVLAPQVLPDPLGAQPPLEQVQDQLTMRLAVAAGGRFGRGDPGGALAG